MMGMPPVMMPGMMMPPGPPGPPGMPGMPPGPPGAPGMMMPPMGGMPMGGGRPAAPKPTKPVI